MARRPRLVERAQESERETEEAGREAFIFVSEVEVGEGRKVKLAKLTLGDLAELERRYEGLDKFFGRMEKLPVSEFLYLLYLSVRKLQPQVTVEQVGDMFPADAILDPKVVAQIHKALGLEALQKAAPKQGEEKAPSPGRRSSTS